MSTDLDLKQVSKMEAKSSAGSPLKKILNEALSQVDKVREFKLLPKNMDQGGSVVPIYDAETKKSFSYILEYCPGKIANLVHELTHISVAESYQCDLINYFCPTATSVEHDVSRGGVCSNLAQIQADWDGKNGGLKANRLQTLQTLISNARDLNFGLRQKIAYFGDDESGYTEIKAKVEITQEIVTKLEYGAKTPHLEYDSVINHVYMWLIIYGYPKKSFFSSKYQERNEFFDLVQNAALQAHTDRQDALLEHMLIKNRNPLYVGAQ